MKKKPTLNKEKVNTYLKYTGLGFQMAGIFLVGILGGQWLDKRFGFEKPIITLVLILVLFTGYLYKLYIDLTSKK